MKNKKTALVQAVDLLARQAHSTARLTRKLKQRQYETEEIEAAVDRLSQRGYLDDQELCRQQFSRYYEERRYSVKYICYKLMQQGFSSEMIDENIPDDTYVRELDTAEKILQRHFKEQAVENKMMQYLYGKGFSTNICRDAVRRFAENEETELF